MKKITLLLFFISGLLFSQNNSMNYVNQEIPATNVWRFLCEKYPYAGFLDVQAGITKQQGILKISTLVSNPVNYIGGTVYLVLDDVSIITCTDKNIRSIDLETNTATSYYFLTPKELEMLKKKNITDIRFKIEGDNSNFNKLGFFTASNKFNKFKVFDIGKRNELLYATKNEIEELLVKK